MRKLGAVRKITQATPPSEEATPYLVPHGDSDESLFFRHVSKVAGVTQKDWRYDLSISKTLVESYYNGTRRDPFTQAQRALSVITEKRPDLRPAILTYISSGEDKFNEALLARLNEVFGRK